MAGVVIGFFILGVFLSLSLFQNLHYSLLKLFTGLANAALMV